MKKIITVAELRATLDGIPDETEVRMTLSRVASPQERVADHLLHFAAAVACGVMLAGGIFDYAEGRSGLVPLLLSGFAAAIFWLWSPAGDRV